MNTLDRIRREFKQMDLEGGFFYKPENRFYVSGFTGSAGYALVTMDGAYLITDFRYFSQVGEQCPDFELMEISTQKSLGEVLSELGLKKVGFEDDFMTIEDMEGLKSKFSGELVPMKRFIEEIRQIKREDEIELIRKAQNIADETFSYMLDYIRPGLTEREVHLELVNQLTRRGADGESFTAIVASGERGALPHGRASDKVIEKGDFLTLDFGCVYKGYCSDMTRTISVGKASDELKEIYEIVLKAQKAALEAIKPGAVCSEVDGVARAIITDAGYGDNFGHGLGHSIGLEVHENPRFNQVDNSILKPGMIMTDEPGIYIPGLGGVRIEDLVLVTEDGCEILSKSDKELIELEF